MCTDAAPAPVVSAATAAEWSGEVIPLQPVDGLSVLSVCDNVVDILLTDQGPARRLGIASVGAAGQLLPAPTLEEGKTIDAPLAEHGFSVQVTLRRGERTRRLLFDTGMTPTGCVDNLRRLGYDPGDLEAIVCSHGHFDHTTGLSGLAAALGRTNLPVVIHPEFWNRRRLAIPGRDPVELPTTSRRGLTEAGFEVVEGRRPSFLFDGALLVTGEVDRTTGFERGFPVHQARRNGSWEPDPLILDDQALIAHVAGKGLVVITGCGHAGVVNIVRYAQRLTGVQAVYAVLGGFHLSGPLFEPIIAATCDALAAIGPQVLVPAHCTGWRAVHALAARFPAAFLANSVGTTYEL
jgi:7,8-dihydropterin-6-yl-methyl-4-(beta-D-ribofuranosyl)aminobenzene 5'-phosphate synthase